VFDNEVILIDSCVFEDTEGSGLDISNAIGLRNAITACSLLRPVVVVDSRSIDTDRGGNFKKLLALLVRFFLSHR